MTAGEAMAELATEAFRFACFGFEMRTDFALPELLPLTGGADLPVVRLRRGTVDAPDPKFGPLAVDGNVAVYTARGIARYRITDGREIVVDPFEGASETMVRLYLLGSALGILCYQRGILPIHANALVVSGEAFAFAGDSGAGKSTLAAHFHRAGYKVLSDDVCGVVLGPGGRPFVVPGLTRLKLWADAAAVFGYDTATLDRAIEGAEKYHVPFREPGDQAPVPFRRLYLLAKSGPEDARRTVRLRGFDALTALAANTYRYEYVDRLGLKSRHFEQCAALLAHVEIYRAVREWGFGVFATEAAALEDHMAGGQETRDLA